jgi:hypothetical protein
MNPRQFLIVGGAVLVLVGVLGFVGVIGPTPSDSIFGAPASRGGGMGPSGLVAEGAGGHASLKHPGSA